MVGQKGDDMTVDVCIKRHEQACQKLKEVLNSLCTENGYKNIEIPDLIQRAAQPILSIKSNQRTACMLLEQTMEKVREQKAEVDAGRVTLQNLAYEKDHLLREIAHCKEYNTTCLENMMETTESREGLTSKKAEMQCFLDPDEHASNLKRLNFQIEERARLVEELQSSEASLSTLKKQTQEKQAFCDDLLQRVENIEKSTYPLQNFFKNGFFQTKTLSFSPSVAKGSTFHAIAMAGNNNNNNNNNAFSKSNSSLMGLMTNQRKRYQRAGKLPTPLYTLCCQLEALAHTMEQQRKHGQEKENLDDIFILQKVSFKVDIAPSKSFTKAASSTTDIDQAYFLQMDPSAVLLHFAVSEKSTSPKNSDNGSLKPTNSTVTSIRFQYLTNLDIVTAIVESNPSANKNGSSNFILSNLFPGDTGSDTPNPTNQYMTCPASGNLFSGFPSPEAMTERPYLWAQWLSGLSFLPPSSLQCKEENPLKKQKLDQLVEPRTTAAIVRLLKRRIWSHFILESLLSKLQKLPNPVPVHPDFETTILPNVTKQEKEKLGRRKESVQLTSWKKIEINDLFATTYKMQFPLEDQKSSRHQHRYYFANLQHSNHSLLEAMVEISPEYPIRAPRWRLYRPTQTQPPPNKTYSSYTSNTKLIDNNLNAIENRVNVDYAMELVDKDKLEESLPWILVHQLRMIMACWDVSQVGKNDQGTFGSLTSRRLKKGRDRRSLRAFERYARGV